MGKRAKIGIGMAAGVVWGVLLIWIGAAFVNIPIFSFTWTLALAFLFPGLVLAAMIGRLAQHRYFDDGTFDGEPFAPDSAAAVDARILQNTVEQSVLALLLWPVAGHLLAVDGPGVVLCLGVGFAIARICFWIGYHISPPLRAFGFAGTFYPTLLAVGWSFLWWVL